jgi:4-hydroxy-4-methyl-2-oxoglutarate aldolase
MKKSVVLCISILFALDLGIFAQTNEKPADERLLDLYNGLRVADVSDGMDIIGLRDAGILDQKIDALWKDTENFTHRICGIAVTARYVPTNKVVKNPMTSDEFKKWESDWYNTLSPEPWTDNIRPGSIVVLDVEGDGDTGSVGSANSLGYIKRGARGIVSNGGVRDIDEIILQRIPVYLDWSQRGRGIRPGRNELESFNKPVTLGGVLIRPGDVIVADGDGVACVPREYAEAVAAEARKILDGDKNARQGLYRELGRELDKTVLP